MGDSISYEFPGLHDPYGLIEGSVANVKRRWEARRAERAAEATRLLDELTAAREIIEVGIVPSDAEANEFYQAIGSATGRLDELDRPALWDFDKEIYCLQDEFYRDRYLTHQWREWLKKLTPDLQKGGHRDLGINITQIWASRVDGGITSGQWSLMPVRDDTLVAVEGSEGSVCLRDV